MARKYSNRYRRKQNNLDEAVANGKVTQQDRDAIIELCNAFDEDNLLVDRPDWSDANSNVNRYKEDSTLSQWIYHCMRYAMEVDSLHDTTVRELNQVAQSWVNGEGDVVGDEGMAKGTIRAYQNSLRVFYRYHDDLGIEYEDIALFRSGDSGPSPRDMLTGSEIQQIRDAADHPRDAALVDLLLYTGMRNTALRTLRRKDIDLGDEVYYYNTEADGLKNVTMVNAPRPLLGAVASVRDWLKYHPSDDPDAYLITGKPAWNDVDPFQPVGQSTVARVMRQIKEDAEIDKPLHPHMIRHNFVSICKRDYDMDDATIRWLIGHSEGSTVMETTYSHLSGADYRKKAEVAAGVRDPDESSALSPNTCDNCGYGLPMDDAMSCPNCGMTFRPDAYSIEKQIEEAMYSSRGEAGEQADDALDTVREMIQQNPELKRRLLEEDAG